MLEKTEGSIKNGQPMPEKLVTLATQDIGQKTKTKQYTQHRKINK